MPAALVEPPDSSRFTAPVVPAVTVAPVVWGRESAATEAPVAVLVCLPSTEPVAPAVLGVTGQWAAAAAAEVGAAASGSAMVEMAAKVVVQAFP